MKFKAGILPLVITSALVATSSAQAISITAESDSNVLAQSIVGNDLSISNINYVGNATQAGIFTNGINSGLGFEQGIVLSTGKASNLQGVNDQTGISSTTSTGGHSGLNALAGASTNDANVLSFDFEIDHSTSSDLFFNFTFASEEYLEFVNAGFNDAFAFFLDGENVATLPGTDTLVSIDNVNDQKNSEFFIDNTDAAYNLQADGFTTMLQISVFDLTAGTHSMEFAIADAGDSSYDSWLLIETGSFTTKPVDVPAPAGILLFALGLAGIGASRKRNK